MPRARPGDRPDAARRKSRVAVWRDAIRDSELGRTTKLVAFVLSTYMDSRCVCWPSQARIAAGASITDKPVHTATLEMVDAGFLLVERSKGRSSHRYVALLPATSDALRRSEWATSELAPPTSDGVPPNIGRAPNESGLKAIESDSSNNLKIMETCMRCKEQGPVSDTGGDLLCDKCLDPPPF